MKNWLNQKNKELVLRDKFLKEKRRKQTPTLVLVSNTQYCDKIKMLGVVLAARNTIIPRIEFFHCAHTLMVLSSNFRNVNKKGRVNNNFAISILETKKKALIKCPICCQTLLLMILMIICIVCIISREMKMNNIAIMTTVNSIISWEVKRWIIASKIPFVNNLKKYRNAIKSGNDVKVSAAERDFTNRCLL